MKRIFRRLYCWLRGHDWQIIRILLVLLCLSSTAWADLIHYDFAGENLTGSFVLDGDTPISITGADSLAVYGNQNSPLNRLQAIFNGVQFEAVPRLQILESRNDLTPDFWVIRVTGQLNLWISLSASYVMPISFDVPFHNGLDSYWFKYELFLDGQWHSGGLTQLDRISQVETLSVTQEVPEGSSMGMLLAGIIAGIGATRYGFRGFVAGR